MIMPIRYLSLGAVLAAGAAVVVPGAAAAQQLPYGDVAATGDAIDAGEGDAAAEEASPRGTGRTRRVAVIPYIEARQVVTAELAPGDEILTYTTLAAGVDANLSGRNNQAGLSLRYERRFGYGENRAAEGDVLSGLARASVAVVPQALTLEAGAMAARMSVADNGATLAGVESGRSSQIYGLTIGPSLKARMGDATVEGHYRFGYNRVEAPLARRRPRGSSRSSSMTRAWSTTPRCALGWHRAPCCRSGLVLAPGGTAKISPIWTSGSRTATCAAM